MKPEVFSALDKTHVPSPWNRVTEQHLVHQQHQQNHGNHRIIGYSGLEGSHQGHRVQLLTLHRTPQEPTLCLRAILKMEVMDPGLKKKTLQSPLHSKPLRPQQIPCPGDISQPHTQACPRPGLALLPVWIIAMTLFQSQEHQGLSSLEPAPHCQILLNTGHFKEPQHLLDVMF